MPKVEMQNQAYRRFKDWGTDQWAQEKLSCVHMHICDNDEK